MDVGWSVDLDCTLGLLEVSGLALNFREKFAFIKNFSRSMFMYESFLFLKEWYRHGSINAKKRLLLKKKILVLVIIYLS